MKNNNLTDLLDGIVEIEQDDQRNEYQLNGIEIPIIQRDYAQGRENVKSIRNRFLDSIFTHLIEDKVLEMDFVYGSIQSIKNGDERRNVFLPLDGQQRLTTLFLMYWFIGNAELQGEKLDSLNKKLSKFSYSTRSTARSFCEKLATIGFKGNVSEEIKSAYWFHQNYEKDPTVMGMLSMLQAIQAMYNQNGKYDLYPKLKNLCFYILPLDGFDLTDELYIKMNARGKSLTDFENFKADLINWIKSDENVEKKDFGKLVTLGSTKVPWSFALASNFDNKWTDLFWAEAKLNDKDEDKIADHYFMRFLNRFFLNQFIISSTESTDTIENSERFKYFYLEDNEGRFKYDSFDNYLKLISVESLKRLDKVFNQLCDHKDKIRLLIKPNWNAKDSWFLYDKDINQRQRILFYATTIFLEKHDFEEDKFASWMRIVWNFIIDPNLRTVSAMIGAMNFIRHLSTYCNNIEEFISTSDFPLFVNYTFFKNQIEQEHHKAILIKKSDQWKAEIVKAESHGLFQGNINFLLSEESKLSIEKFIQLRETSFALFQDNTLTDISSNYLWIRALLAQTADIELPLTLSNGRFNNWCYLINEQLKSSMQHLIHKLTTSNLPINESLSKICVNYEMNNEHTWIFPLVNWVGINGETLLGNFSETRKILEYDNYGYDPKHVYLYNKINWSEGNIVLSGNRNEVLARLLMFNPAIKLVNDETNIQNKFYKGKDVELNRIHENILFTYSFDRSDVMIGFECNSTFETDFPKYPLTDDQINDGWIFIKSYNYSELEDLAIDVLFQKIENEIFDLSNSNSEINKII